MKYFLDTEFHEYKRKGIDTIELISIGIVNEEGKEYYAVCNEFDVKAAWDNEWLRENVLKSIWEELNVEMGTYHKTYFYNTTNKFCLKHLKRLLKWRGKTKAEIAKEIKDAIYAPWTQEQELSTNGNFTPKDVEFYAYYADYDWVVFCWLFGRMIDLPKGFPMYCKDLKQIMDEQGYGSDWKKQYCPDPIGEHNALVDAKWNLALFTQMGL